MFAVVGMLMFGTTTLRRASIAVVLVALTVGMCLLRDQRRTKSLIDSTALLLLGLWFTIQSLRAFSGTKGLALWPINLLGAAVGVGVLVWSGRELWRERRAVESRARGMIRRPISEVVEAIGAPTEVIAREEVESGKSPFPPTGWTLERARAVTASVYLYLDVPRGDYVCLFVDDGGILIDVVRAYS